MGRTRMGEVMSSIKKRFRFTLTVVVEGDVWAFRPTEFSENAALDADTWRGFLDSVMDLHKSSDETHTITADVAEVPNG